MESKCPVCGEKPNKWVDDDLSLFWGHCGVTCEGRERWSQYAAAMELARARVDLRNCEQDDIFTHIRVNYSAAASRAESTVPFTRDECGYVCEALEESERLKEAVAWLFECEACGNWMDRRGWFQDEMEEIYAAARKAVEELL